MRSPVTKLIQDFQVLNAEEQKVFLDLVDPQPEPQEAKPARKKRASNNGKSKRASGMAAAIKTSLEASQQASASRDGEPQGLTCIRKLDDGNLCDSEERYAIHDESAGLLGYHAFEPPKGKRSLAVAK